MLHFDYNWDLYPNVIKLDPELNTDQLGWKNGDLFRFTNVNGQQMLKKVDPLEHFIREGAKHVQREQMANVVEKSTRTPTDLSQESANLA